MKSSKPFRSFLQFAIVGVMLFVGCASPVGTGDRMLQTTTVVTAHPLRAPATSVMPTASQGAFVEIPYQESQWAFYALDDHVPPVLAAQGTANIVLSIAFSPEGIAWLGTGAGLWRYENGNWTAFLEKDGMLTDYVSSVSVAPDGNIWVGSPAGISRFDGKTWRTYPMPNLESEGGIGQIAAGWYAYAKVWAIPYNGYGALYFDGKEWQTIEIGRQPELIAESVIVTPWQTILFGTRSRGIFLLQGEEWTQYPFQGMGTAVTDLTIAPDRTLWATIIGTGILHLIDWTTHWTIYPYDDESGLWAIAVSEGGRVWVGGRKGPQGVGRTVSFLESGRWYTFSGLPFDTVYDIQIAPDGAVWFATGNGLYIYRE